MSGTPEFVEARLKSLFECSPIAMWEEDLSQVFARLDELHATGVSCWEDYFEQNPAEVTYCAGLVRIVNINQKGTSLFQAENKESLIRELPEFFSSSSWEVFRHRLISLAEGALDYSGEIEMLTMHGERKQLLLQWNMVPDNFDALKNVVVSLIDITERKRNERRDKLYAHVLELISSDAPLKQALCAVASCAEEEYADARCSIMLLDRDALYLTTGAAPSLPDFYNNAINRIVICREADACSSSGCICKRFVVEDIQSHPDWKQLRAAAIQAGLHSCWSQPILSTTGELAGAMTIYHRTSKTPSSSDINAIEFFARLAGIAIERHNTQQKLHLATMAYQGMGEAVLVTDMDGFVIAANAAFTKITGYSQEEIVGQSTKMLSAGRYNQFFSKSIRESLLTHGQWRGEISNRHKNGEEYSVWLSINNVYDEKGKVAKRVASFSDTSKRNPAEKMVAGQTDYDLLAALPNRQQFRDHLDREIKKAHRDGLGVALLAIDLDKFKEVNETLGHNMGDVLLQEAARRIASCVRDRDTVARFGGDEFAVILTAYPDVKRVEQIARSINNKISEPFQFGDEVVYISASIGITFYPLDGVDADVLIKNAEQSMYVAKNDGRNRYSFYTSSLQEAAQARRVMLNDLRGALADKQFRVYFQPIIDLKSGRILKAEALLRWQHPVLGMVGPMEFIPLAEETGLINDIGDWVFRESANCAKRWSEIYPGGIQISINKSAAQFRNSRNADKWVNYLAEIGLPGNNVVVEITESILLDSSPNIFDQLSKYREAGIQISIDDFGTGYSSLSYLKKFDADYLKIDRSFIMDMVSNNQDMVLSEAIIAMAHKLGIAVIAEGIETEEQEKLLADASCNFGQGFHFSKAISAQEFEFLLDSKKYRTHSHSQILH
ncbi:putative signaling protein [Gallionellaceae bacterium]|nr:putative signaling protein [Gallionellaceae bacterium]